MGQLVQTVPYQGHTNYAEALLVSEIKFTASEVLIFGKIASMARANDGCFASNEYLAVVGRCSVPTVTRAIARLVKLGVMTTNGSKNSRRFRLTKSGWSLAVASAGEEAAAPAPPPKSEKKERKKVNATVEEHCERELPDWLDRDVWKGFVEYRHHDKGAFTVRSADGVIDDLTKLRAEGHCPRKLLELAAKRGWLVPYAKDELTKSTSGLTGDRRIGRNGEMVIPGEGVFI
jgi:hypothetical protein